ncbi:midline-1-like protein [Aphelenchoides avenae]|nr:midline-1-like protein [Aphelenchus avenae]
MVPTTSSCTEHQIVVPECTICLDMYRDPLTLPACGHSVCSGVRATANREYGLTRQRRLPRVSRSFARDAERFPAELRTFGIFLHPLHATPLGIIATLEAAGYRETSQCSGCRSLVPNRKLRECETCATEASLLLCADCALRRHKDHDLVSFVAHQFQRREILALEQSRRIRSPSTKGFRWSNMAKESAKQAEPSTANQSLTMDIAVAASATSFAIAQLITSAASVGSVVCPECRILSPARRELKATLVLAKVVATTDAADVCQSWRQTEGFTGVLPAPLKVESVIRPIACFHILSLALQNGDSSSKEMGKRGDLKFYESNISLRISTRRPLRNRASLCPASRLTMVPISSSHTKSEDCPVCLEMYRDPLTLPSCGHSVCSACVRQMIANTASPGNVVCPECRVHSPVTPNGFPRNYRLADMIATLEAAGNHDTSQCSGCRSQVPNRSLRQSKTCATEDSLLFCADCALRRHKDHDLGEFRGPPAPVPRTPSVRAVPANPVTIDEVIPLLEELCDRLKAAALAVIKAIFAFLCIAVAVFIVGILYDLMGPLNVLMVLAFGLVIYAICACCLYDDSRETYIKLIANTTAPGNVVCPECRVQSPVTANGFPRSYRLAGIIATMEAAGYRETSQCSGCRSQVPNRRLRECVTCAAEGSLLLCADCALRRHQHHYLVEFRGPPPPVPRRSSSIRAVAPNPVAVDDRASLVGRTHRQPVVDDGQRRRYERNQSRDRYARFKTAVLTVIKGVVAFLCAAATVFVVGIFFDSVGPIEALSICMLVMLFGLAIYGIGASCHRVYQEEF